MMAPLLRLGMFGDGSKDDRLAPLPPDKCIEERKEKRSDSWGLGLASLWLSMGRSWSSPSTKKESQWHFKFPNQVEILSFLAALDLVWDSEFKTSILVTSSRIKSN